MPTVTAAPVVDPDEKHVEEVHCSECNAPIPAIPNWYAQVRVNFTCDACRQKSPRLATAPPAFAAAGAAVVAAAPVVADDPDAALDEAALDPEADAEDLDLGDEAETDEAEEPAAEE